MNHNFIVLTKGHTVPTITVEKFTITQDEIDEVIDDGDATDEDDAINQLLADEAAAASQGFNNTFFIEEGEKDELIKKLSKIKF